MPPQLAAFLTWGFVLYLLVRDVKHAPKTLPGLWVAVLWILILGSKPPHYWFAPGSGEIGVEAYEEGNTFNQVAYLGLIVFGIIVLWRRRVDWGDLMRRNGALFVFIGYCVLSIAWSDYPLVTLKGNIKALLGNLVMAVIVLTDRNPIEAIKTLIRRCAFVLVPLSVLVIKYFPDIGRSTHRYSDETMFRGVASGGNGLAITCYICALLIIWNLIRKGSLEDRREFGINLLMLSMIVWLMMKADGGSAEVSLMIGTSLLFLMRWSMFKGQVVSLGRNMGTVLIMASPIVVLNYSWFMDTVAYFFGHSETLWGRLEVWRRVVALVENPLLGTGYGSFWLGERLEAMWAIYWWKPTEAHNGYVETYLNLGIVGVILLATLIVAVCRKAGRSALKPELQLLKLTYLVPILFFNLTEAAFRGLHLVWFMFLLFAIEAHGQMQEESSEAAAPVRARLRRSWSRVTVPLPQHVLSEATDAPLEMPSSKRVGAPRIGRVPLRRDVVVTAEQPRSRTGLARLRFEPREEFGSQPKQREVGTHRLADIHRRRK